MAEEKELSVEEEHIFMTIMEIIKNLKQGEFYMVDPVIFGQREFNLFLSVVGKGFLNYDRKTCQPYITEKSCPEFKRILARGD